MVFGFFSRKSVQPTPSEANVAGSSQLPTHFQFPTIKQLHTPAPSIDSDAFFNGKRPSPSRTTDSDPQLPPGPTDTPSPPPDDTEQVTDPTALHALIASVPAQTLQSYTLAHLSRTPSLQFPTSTAPLSPQTLTILTQFFTSLTPPPRLHCVRCHRGFFELENTDRSCTVAHDDDSAIVERVRTGLGTEYETLWGCCEKTVEGDGDMGPPDGWCYEGKHTTDIKRARFRADSTPHEDKLTSCVTLRCHEPPAPRRSSTSRTSRKRSRRTMELDDNQDEDRASMISSHSQSISVSIGSTKGKEKAKVEGEEEEASAKPRPAKRRRAKTTKKQKADEDNMDVDPPLPTPVRPSPPKSPCRKPTTKTPLSPTKSRSKPKSTAPITPKPKSTPLQRSPLSASFMPGTADIRPPSPLSDPVTRSESPTRKNRVEVEILTAPGRKALSAKGSVGSLKRRSSAGSMNVDPNAKSRASNKAKALDEIVDTSIDGEVEWK
ncbi:hypothetical protein BYT27DRAFT_7102948 [Phlegmacium glaucopus]|nr:hypothetical protein BYT27DRAFT_7102948 [Phlegmacium glaucopus]